MSFSIAVDIRSLASSPSVSTTLQTTDNNLIRNRLDTRHASHEIRQLSASGRLNCRHGRRLVFLSYFVWRKSNKIQPARPGPARPILCTPYVAQAHTKKYSGAVICFASSLMCFLFLSSPSQLLHRRPPNAQRPPCTLLSVEATLLGRTLTAHHRSQAKISNDKRQPGGGRQRRASKSRESYETRPKKNHGLLALRHIYFWLRVRLSFLFPLPLSTSSLSQPHAPDVFDASVWLFRRAPE